MESIKTKSLAALDQVNEGLGALREALQGLPEEQDAQAGPATPSNHSDCDQFTRSVCQKVGEIRRSRDWSVTEFARRASCTSTWINTLEKGGSNLTLQSIYKLARILEVPPAKLFEPLGED